MRGYRPDRQLGVRTSALLRGIAATALLGLAACEAPLSPQLALVLSQPAVEFRALRGSTGPLAQTITVSNAGSGRLGPVSCPAAPAPWLSCAVSEGNIVTLTANPAALTETPPQATVELSAPGASGTVPILVTLRIDEPVLTLNASTVSFFASEGGGTTDPATRTITVANTGAGALADLGTISCAPTPANARVTCAVNQSNGILTVSVSPTGLAPGTYIYPVTVGSQNSSTSQTFSVALTVGALPRLALSRQSVHFQMTRGATATQTQTVTLSNAGTGVLGALACTSPVSWLTCSITGTTLSLTASAAGLDTPPPPVQVSVTAANAINSPVILTVTLGLDQPVLSLSAGAVTFTVVEGTGLITPASHLVLASNVGAGEAESLGAITCAPQAGSPVACEVTGVQLTLTVDPTGVGPGLTTYPVTVTAQHSHVTRTIVVTLNVTRIIELSASAVHFTAVRGSATPINQIVTVTSRSGAQLGTLSCPTAPASWLTCTPAAGQVTFSVNPSGLTASPSAVAVPITSSLLSTGDQGTESVTITLTIEQPVLTVSPAAVDITGAGSTDVQVGNAGAGNLQSLGTIACSPAANVTCSVNQATGVITITTVPGALAAGTYVREVGVTAANASNAQAVTVILRVP